MLSELDREMTLEARTGVPDGSGGSVEEWIALGRLWVRLRAARGQEAAGEANALSRSRWTATVRGAAIGDPARPAPGQRLREGTRAFRILSVTERDGAGRWLDCRVVEELVP